MSGCLPALASAALSPETITLGTFSVTGPVIDAGSLAVAGQDTGVSSPVMANSHTPTTP